AGIEVVTGVLEKECVKMNEVFFHFIKNKTPFVIMKYAMTMDGKIATYTGHSKWITGEVARENVHKDRNRYTGIMVGIGTIIADNPHLTCRIDNGRNPIPIICDTNLKTPLNCNLMETAKEVKTIIATTVTQESEHKPFINKGCEIVIVPKKNNHLDLKALMSKLYEMKIDSILLEGGGTLNFSAIEEQIVQKIQCYISPKLIGGSNAKTPVEGIGFPKMSDAVVLKNTTITNFGEDFLIESEVQY
ncbi:MAG: bifunctional diaminohydroxyphosphoribosylaminopyrimidine deaminase/5-amino-6-(5-phosphoribosylamino)uracil reductase RibD, partial [Anaerotignaceae bacterium]